MVCLFRITGNYEFQEIVTDSETEEEDGSDIETEIDFEEEKNKILNDSATSERTSSIHLLIFVALHWKNRILRIVKPFVTK